MEIRRTICVIACSKSKRNYACPARLLYIGTAFKQSVKFAESKGLKWFVLSAKYGIVQPETIIAPYEQTLQALSREQRDVWITKVRKQLTESYPRTNFIILAGGMYKDPFKGMAITEPLKGLSQGKRIQRLKQLCEQS